VTDQYGPGGTHRSGDAYGRAGLTVTMSLEDGGVSFDVENPERDFR